MCYKVGRFAEYQEIQNYLRGYDGADTQSRDEALSNIDVEDDGTDWYECETEGVEFKKTGCHTFKIVRM